MKIDFDEEGYLGEQIFEIRNDLIQKFDKLFSFAKQFNRLAQEEKFNFNFLINKQHASISTLFCRILNSYQSVILLLSFGLLIEAEVVLRGLIEASFLLSACCKDVNFADLYLNSFHAQRLRFAKNVHSKNFSDFLKDNIPTTHLEKLKAKCKKEGAREIKVKEIAEKAGMEYYYYGPYWDLSLSSHASPKSTEYYLNETKDGFYLELCPNPNPERIKLIIILTIDMLIRNLITIYDFLGNDQPEILEKMFNEWKGLIAE